MIVEDEKGNKMWIPRIAETYEEALEDLILFGMYCIKDN